MPLHKFLDAAGERRAAVPMGRYGSADEVAATIAFLLSEGAGYITGQNIRIDGGIKILDNFLNQNSQAEAQLVQAQQ